MGKLTTYPADTRFTSGDILIKDGSGGTKKILASDAASDFAGMVSAINHRNIYRGKNLGTVITAAQQTAIQSGTFDDLFIGDYWTLNGHVYEIADMNYWYNCGDTAFTKNHLVMVPRNKMYDATMNTTNTTDGGYVGSLMYTANLDTAKSQITTDFGSLILSHRQYFTNAVTNGAPSGGAWFDSTVDLMNEPMVYGSYIFAPGGDGAAIPTRYTIDNSQLALFRLNPRTYKNRETTWLRDVVSASDFAFVGIYGLTACYYASNSVGVRPAFAVGLA